MAGVAKGLEVFQGVRTAPPPGDDVVHVQGRGPAPSAKGLPAQDHEAEFPPGGPVAAGRRMGAVSVYGPGEGGPGWSMNREAVWHTLENTLRPARYGAGDLQVPGPVEGLAGSGPAAEGLDSAPGSGHGLGGFPGGAGVPVAFGEKGLAAEGPVRDGQGLQEIP